MRSIDPYQFYRIGSMVNPLTNIDGSKTVKDAWVDLLVAASWLEYLLSGNLVELQVSREAISELLNAIRAVIPATGRPADADLEKKLDETPTLWRLKSMTTDMETILAAEIHTLPSYIVSRKGIYHTDDLIEHAERAFDVDTLKYIPDGAVKDFREAGRCLAFELPTASAFHVMRAAEAVLRKWHRLVKKLPATEKSPMWNPCINEIKAAGGDPKVTAILDQIRDLHRNPTMHPEDFLGMPEALALFDVTKSAIATMAGEIRKVTP